MADQLTSATTDHHHHPVPRRLSPTHLLLAAAITGGAYLLGSQSPGERALASADDAARGRDHVVVVDSMAPAVVLPSAGARAIVPGAHGRYWIVHHDGFAEPVLVDRREQLLWSLDPD